MIEVHRIPSEKDKIVMQMTEKNTILCEASAKIEGNLATIEYINEMTTYVSYDMGKALLNAIDLQGISEVKCENEDLAIVLKNLGFKQQDGVYLLNLTNYFTTNCKKL